MAVVGPGLCEGRFSDDEGFPGEHWHLVVSGGMYNTGDQQQQRFSPGFELIPGSFYD